MIRVGLIGIGAMGNVHYKAYKNIAEAKVIAVADPRLDMAKEKIGDDDVKLYANVDEMLANEELDMLDICLPSYMHKDASIKALEMGYHVLCEKPMSISSKDTPAMIEAAKKSGKKFMIAHVVRFMKPYEYLKSIVDSGELGKLVHIDMRRGSTIPSNSWENWMQDLKKSGGTPIDLSIHDIDFVQYVFGEPKEVWGTYRQLNNKSDCVVSNFTYDDFDITMTAGWYKCTKPFKAEYLAIFEEGYIESIGDDLLKNGEPVEVETEQAGDDKDLYIITDSGYENEIRYFVNCIINDTNPDKVTPESSEASVKLVERILENTHRI